MERFVLTEKGRPSLCHAKRIGSKAKALLAQPGFSGRVLAVLSTTVYIASKDGEILWLSPEALAMHGRCILAPFKPRAICPGQDFFVEGPFLRISDKVVLDLDPATEWRPTGVGPKHPEPLTVVRRTVSRLVEAAARFANAKGFGQMIPMIPSLVGSKRQAISNTHPLLARAHNSILALATACLNLDMKEVARTGRELVGFGPGLTPSGDDFLGGLLFAARSLKTAYPQDFNWKEGPVIDLIDWASTQTHPISHAILRDHAFGQGPEPLHEVVVSLFNGLGLSHTMGEAECLLAIGETSGWDILAGMLIGMLLIEGKLKNNHGGKR